MPDALQRAAGSSDGHAITKVERPRSGVYGGSRVGPGEEGIDELGPVGDAFEPVLGDGCAWPAVLSTAPICPMFGTWAGLMGQACELAVSGQWAAVAALYSAMMAAGMRPRGGR
jgi:hypothetical protein